MMIDKIETNPIPQHLLRSNESFFTHEDFTETSIIEYGKHHVVTKAILQQTSGGITMAIKRPYLPQYSDNNMKRAMKREAVVGNRLGTHKNIIGVLDWGREDIPWIAMNYADGGTLYEKKDDMSFEQLLWTCIHIAKAIQYAHRNNILHSDIKNTNIVFQDTSDVWNTPKLLDWGSSDGDAEWVPKYADGKQYKSFPSGFINTTARKTTGGDSHVLSPEHLRYREGTGNPSDYDNRTDIYQLGAMFYHLLTGIPTYNTRDNNIPRKKQKKIRNNDIINTSTQPKTPSEISSVPKSLDNILLKALKTRKKDRYQHVHQFKQDLVRVYNEEADSHHPNAY